MADWDALLLALLRGSSDRALEEVHAKRSSALSSYARSWFSLVGKELLADISEATTRWRPDPRQKAAAYNLSFVKPSEDCQQIAFVTLTVSSKGDAECEMQAAPAGREEEDGSDPPLNYQVLFSPDRAVAWCLTTPVSTLAGVFRAVALDASGPLDLLPLDQRLLSAPSFPGCIPVTTSMSALYRAHALSRLHLLHPSILIALVPGASLPRDNEESEELWPFSHCGPGTPGDQQLRPILNDGQQRALEGLSAPVEAVQGPPGTGKSSFISEAFLRRIPKSSRVLACTSTNKAIDSLVAKFEDAGVREMIAVGSRQRMGSASQRFLLSARMSRDPVVARAESLLASVRRKREVAEEKVAQAKKPKKPKKDKGGKEDNRGFVKRTMDKIKADKKAAKKTPGVVRLMKIIGMVDPAPTNAELARAAAAYLDKPPDEEDAAAFDELANARAELKKLEKLEEKVEIEAAKLRLRAGRRIWRAARFVACTASSAVHVTRRLVQDMEEDETDAGEGGSQRMAFEYVILDEAGAMLEPDAIGTLIHGARALLLVGDHFQLQPFSKWQAASSNRYNVSLMERLVTSGMKAAMLTEQYRMHPDISRIVSRCFYSSKLTTAAPTAAARCHPLPVTFIEAGGEESRPEGATSWRNEEEAAAVVDLVALLISHAHHTQGEVVVLTFYNGQRSLLASQLAARGLKDVDVVSVDAMQGREADVIVLSCVRTSGYGLGFLADWRRLNVALSRAREQMVVVGTQSCLETDRNWRQALQDMPRAHLGLNSFKGAYCSSVPSGWAERAASRLRPTSSSSAISCQPRALGVDCGLDPASARELRVLERLAADTGGEAQQGELLGTGVASLSLGSTGGAADSAWGDEGPSGNRLLGGDTREVAESWDDDVGEVSGCENGSPPTAPCAVRKPHHHEEAGRSSLGEGNEGGDSKAEDSIDSWGSDSAGDEGSGAPRRPPAVQVLVSELEVAGSMQEALEKAAARLAEACPRRPQQALLLSGVAALLEPGGASDLPGAAVRALSSTTLVRVAKALYDLDVVEEEAVMEWVEDMKTAARLSGSDGPYTLRIKQMAPFVKWLQEADGASSGDE